MAYKAGTRQANLSAVHFVAAEILRRGAWADVMAISARLALVMAGRQHGSHEITIRVHARRSGDWQPGLPKDIDPAADFRILVDMTGNTIPGEDDYYVVPEWRFTTWVTEDHARKTAPYAGARAQGGDSSHKRVTTRDAQQLTEGWSGLGIF